MTAPTGFRSWSNYFQFALAREFVDRESNLPYKNRNFLERVGHSVAQPLLAPTNFLFENIKNPVMILACTVMTIALISVAFYPAQMIGLMTTVLPLLANIEVWMIKGVIFGALEGTILAVGMRALGRVCNPQLRADWLAGQVTALQLGTQVR